MAKKNQKHKNKQEHKQPTSQPIAPATPLELTDEELEQVAGGISWGGGVGDAMQPASSIIHGVGAVGFN